MNAIEKIEFSDVEREAVVLQIAIESIDSMVNREMFNFSEGNQKQAGFRTLSSRQLFAVLLADFLEQVDRKLLGVKGSLLDALQQVASTPRLATAKDAANLVQAVSALQDWLGTSVEVEVWFPSLERQVTLTLCRRDFVAICGNLSKHNLSRLTRNAGRLRDLLANNGVTAGSTESLLALGDFYDRFHVDILAYHSTTLAEMLTEIRWATHEYLEPEFERAYRPPPSANDPRYTFKYPDGLVDSFAVDCYWDIMNSVRSKPWIPRFRGTQNLKGRY